MPARETEWKREVGREEEGGADLPHICLCNLLILRAFAARVNNSNSHGNNASPPLAPTPPPRHLCHITYSFRSLPQHKAIKANDARSGAQENFESKSHQTHTHTHARIHWHTHTKPINEICASSIKRERERREGERERGRAHATKRHTNKMRLKKYT